LLKQNGLDARITNLKMPSLKTNSIATINKSCDVKHQYKVYEYVLDIE